MKRILLIIKRWFGVRLTYGEIAEISGYGPCLRCVGRALADLPSEQTIVESTLDKWIKCSERTPEMARYVIAIENRGGYVLPIIASCINGVWSAFGETRPSWEPTHWTPLPIIPSVEK